MYIVDIIENFFAVFPFGILLLSEHCENLYFTINGSTIMK